jgi:hypothetical protein
MASGSCSCGGSFRRWPDRSWATVRLYAADRTAFSAVSVRPGFTQIRTGKTTVGTRPIVVFRRLLPKGLADIASGNLDRRDDEVDDLKRFVQAVKENPWPSMWCEPTGFIALGLTLFAVSMFLKPRTAPRSRGTAPRGHGRGEAQVDGDGMTLRHSRCHVGGRRRCHHCGTAGLIPLPRLRRRAACGGGWQNRWRGCCHARVLRPRPRHPAPQPRRVRRRPLPGEMAAG